MKSLRDYLIKHTSFPYVEQYITEMATIGRDVKFDKNLYDVAIHGASTADRPYPHIHIYLANDRNRQKFNFEISLIDILAYDEINLIAQIDKAAGINRKNRRICSWTGYRRLKDNFEDWLSQKPKELPGEWKDNLHAICWACDHESYRYEGKDGSYIKNYMNDRGLSIIDKYKDYISDDITN